MVCGNIWVEIKELTHYSQSYVLNINIECLKKGKRMCFKLNLRLPSISLDSEC